MNRLFNAIKNKWLWQLSLWFSGYGRRRGSAWEEEKARIREELDELGAKRHSFRDELLRAIKRVR